MFEDYKNDITDLINNLDLLGKGNLKYLAMKLDYNNYYSDREAEINNRNQGGNNMIEEEYKSEDEQYDKEEGENYENNRLEDEIKASYDEMLNETNKIDMKDFLNEEYNKKYEQ